jgi:hypothetical protein
MECIICQDIGSEQLQENTFCSCKYKCHTSCWLKYIYSKINITCPLCRKDINQQISSKSQATIHTPLIQPSAPPYSSQELIEHNSQQISYQEFVEIIQQYNLSDNTVINVRSSTYPTNNRDPPISQKITKVVIGLTILIVIIVLLFVFMKIF